MDEIERCDEIFKSYDLKEFPLWLALLGWADLEIEKMFIREEAEKALKSENQEE